MQLIFFVCAAASEKNLCFLRNARLLRKENVQLLPERYFVCVTASGNILCFLRNVRLLLKENVQLLLRIMYVHLRNILK